MRLAVARMLLLLLAAPSCYALRKLTPPNNLQEHQRRRAHERAAPPPRPHLAPSRHSATSTTTTLPSHLVQGSLPSRRDVHADHAAAAAAAVSRAPRVAMDFRLPRGGPPGFDPSSLVALLVLAALVASGAIWSIVSFVNGLFLVLFLVPLVGGPLLNFYLNNNLLEGTCPDCGYPQQLLKGSSHQCLNCGAVMSSELTESGVFIRERLSDGGAVVDVNSIDVDAS